MLCLECALANWEIPFHVLFCLSIVRSDHCHSVFYLGLGPTESESHSEALFR